MHKTALPLVACLLALAATGASAQANIWKWRDASGQLHISDMAPPPGTPVKAIVQRPNGSASAAVAGEAAPSAPTAVPPVSDLQKKKLQADQDKADKLAADKAALDKNNAAVRKDNCQRAQTQASALQNGARMSRMNANGEREVLDDAGRAAELKHAQDIAAQNCGPAPAAAQ